MRLRFGPGWTASKFSRRATARRFRRATWKHYGLVLGLPSLDRGSAVSLSKQAGVARAGAEYKLEQRRHAAADGLCHTRCAVKVAPGRSTCPKCSADASARTVRRRRAIRTKSENER